MTEETEAALVPMRPRHLFRPVDDNGNQGRPMSWSMNIPALKGISKAIGVLESRRDSDALQSLLEPEAAELLRKLVETVAITAEQKQQASQAITEYLLSDIKYSSSFRNQLGDEAITLATLATASTHSVPMLGSLLRHLRESAFGKEEVEEDATGKEQKESFVSAQSDPALFWTQQGAHAASEEAQQEEKSAEAKANASTSSIDAMLRQGAYNAFTSPEDNRSQGGLGKRASSSPGGVESNNHLGLSDWCLKQRLDSAFVGLSPDTAQLLGYLIEALLHAIHFTASQAQTLSMQTSSNIAPRVSDLTSQLLRLKEEDQSWREKWDAFWNHTVYRGDRITDPDGIRNVGVYFVDALPESDDWQLILALGEYGYGIPPSLSVAPLAYLRDYLCLGHFYISVDCSALSEDCELRPMVDFLLEKARRMAAEELNAPPGTSAPDEVPWQMSRESNTSAELNQLLVSGSRAIGISIGSAMIQNWQPRWAENPDAVTLDEDYLQSIWPVRQPMVKNASVA